MWLRSVALPGNDPDFSVSLLLKRTRRHRFKG